MLSIQACDVTRDEWISDERPSSSTTKTLYSAPSLTPSPSLIAAANAVEKRRTSGVDAGRDTGTSRQPHPAPVRHGGWL